MRVIELDPLLLARFQQLLVSHLVVEVVIIGQFQPVLSCELDGTCSFDAETATEDLEYEWTASAGSIDPSDGATPTGSFALGEHSVELVVTDEDGLASEAAHGSVEIVDTVPPVIVLVGEAEKAQAILDEWTEAPHALAA